MINRKPQVKTPPAPPQKPAEASPGELKIEYRVTADLVPYANNARIHSDKQVEQIAESIRRFGWVEPVVVDGRNGIVSGHGRVMAAKKLGYERVPVLEVSHLSEDDKKALVLALNKIAQNAGWDHSLLATEFESLKLNNYDLKLTGFSETEVAQVIRGVEPPKLIEEEPKGKSTLVHRCPKCGCGFSGE